MPIATRRSRNRLPCNGRPPAAACKGLEFLVSTADYRIVVTQQLAGNHPATQEATVMTTYLDGVRVGEQGVLLLDDQREHLVEVNLG